MLDFNDTQKPVEPRRILDDSEREALRSGLITSLSSVLATLFLGEIPRLFHGVGIGLIFLGIYLTTAGRAA